MASAVNIVKSFFPQVEHVRDAKKDITLEVTKRDVNSAAVRKHNQCAMAVACKRAEAADGVIVSVGTVYVVKGDVALRYKPSQLVAREIVSFDRNGGFATGEYVLKAPCPSERLGGSSNRGSNGPHTGNKSIRRKHMTAGIRTVLGSKITPDAA